MDLLIVIPIVWQIITGVLPKLLGPRHPTAWVWRAEVSGQHALGSSYETGDLGRHSLPANHGLSPQEVFGLGPGFMRRELDGARRRLARELHPDRWQQASPRERHRREEALKRVNAAFGVLRRQT